MGGLRVIIPVFIGVFLVTLVAVIALTCATGSGSDSEGPSRTQATPTATRGPAAGSPEQALARYVETLGKGYVEDCGRADAGRDAGKFCSIFRGEREGKRAYILGLVASEPAQWAILEQQSGEWKVVYAPKITFDTSGVPGIPWPLKTGVEVVVVTKPDPCLNVREGPSLNQAAVDCINDGTRIKLAAGPVEADDFQWWQVEGRTGWVAADYLRYPDAAQ